MKALIKKLDKIASELERVAVSKKPVSSIEFDGKNTKDVMKFVSSHGLEPKLEPNGKLSVSVSGKEQTIFKGDSVSFQNGKLNIEKPWMRWMRLPLDEFDLPNGISSKKS